MQFRLFTCTVVPAIVGWRTIGILLQRANCVWQIQDDAEESKTHATLSRVVVRGARFRGMRGSVNWEEGRGEGRLSITQQKMGKKAASRSISK